VHEVRMHASSIREPTMNGLPATTDVKPPLYSLRPLAKKCLCPKSYDVAPLGLNVLRFRLMSTRADLGANNISSTSSDSR